MPRSASIANVISLFLTMLVAGCVSTALLAPTPNVYAVAAGYSDAGISPAWRTTKAELLYITDRAAEPKAGGVEYGLRRSSSMAFGTAQVSFEGVSSWEELKALSGMQRRSRPINLKVQRIEEKVRFSRSPLPFERIDGRVRTLPEEESIYRGQQAELQAAIRARLGASVKKEVMLFVPGVRNTFDEGAQSLTNLWHFSQRHGVPILLSWPSGNGGLTGYFRDSDAAEFSIFHFKQLVGIIASMPEVERIHLIAHSHGAEIATSGMRELIIAEREKGNAPVETLKIANLILAAPDLDFGVVQQRLIAERFGPAFGRVTVYMNPEDDALGLAQSVLSGTRFGRLSAMDLDESEMRVLAGIRNVNFVDVNASSGGLGHSYFRDNPAVLSDIALSIQTNAAPGTPSRPLTKNGDIFWTLNENYPF
ncbi:alpha/beta hydrolase [Rhizobiaceae bacterium]|nr:alpha/beta hydrolase [Rhizobiaceae bacterium]